MRMHQNYIFWNNMDIISLHKTMYTSFEKKKHHGEVRKVQSEFIAIVIESIDLILSCIFLYPNIFFDPLLAMILFHDEIFKVIFLI